MKAQHPTHKAFKGFADTRSTAILPFHVINKYWQEALRGFDYGDAEVVEQFTSLNAARQIANQAQCYVEALNAEFTRQLHVVFFWSTRSDDDNGEFPYAAELADAERHLTAIAQARLTAIRQVEVAESWHLQNDHWAHVVAFLEDGYCPPAPREYYAV